MDSFIFGEQSAIKIKKLRSNYEVRFSYDEGITNFLKTFPKDHHQTKMDPINHEGRVIEDWYHLMNEAGLYKLLKYLKENHYTYSFENLKEEEVEQVLQKKEIKEVSTESALKAKADSIDVSKVDFSFMKKQPYDYQKQAVLFFEQCGGKAILGDAPGVGKAQNVKCNVLTLNGWKEIGQIKVGDKLFHHSGRICNVLNVYPQGVHDSYKIIFNDGSFTECNLEHLWLIRDKNRRNRGTGWVVKSLNEILKSGISYNHNLNSKRLKTNRKNLLKWEIPVVCPIPFSEKNFIIDPYILGCLIGDGYIANEKSICISIHNSQLEIKENIDQRLPINLKTRGSHFSSSCPQYFISQNYGNNTLRNPYVQEIKRLRLNKLSHDKFIPKEYLIGSYVQRLELLRGLMDTDGSALKNRINFHTVSKQLAMDVCELVQSLGGQTIFKAYNRNKDGKGIEYRVNVRLNECPFHLENKKKQWNKRKRHLIRRYISKIEKINSCDQVCIHVNSPDNTYITDNYIVTHNTLSSLSYAVKNKLKTLVVCPASLKLNWRNEIANFTNEKYFIYKYKPSKKSTDPVYSKEESLFHIINYEGLESYIKFNNSHTCQNYNCKEKWNDLTKKHKKCPHCGKLNVVRSRIGAVELIEKDGVSLKPSDYDLIVLDESHYVKNPKAMRTKLVVKPFKDIKHKLLLTGTAIKNRPYEFFTLLNFVDPDEWKNAHTFAVRYCDAKENRFGWDYNGASNLEELYNRISPYFLRRLKKDVLKFLPDKTYTVIPIELSKEEQREYNKIEKSIIEETNETDPDVTHLARIQKLKQFTSRIKLEQAFDFIQNFVDGGEKIVVFTQYLEIAGSLNTHFQDCSVIFTGKHNMDEKQLAVDEFMNNENIKIFVGTIAAAGVGITLTSASTLLFIDAAWSPSDMIQAEDRIHRASQTSDKVQIINLICSGTIDEDIERLLKEKEKVVDKLLDGVELDKKVTRIEGSIFKDLVQTLIDKK